MFDAIAGLVAAVSMMGWHDGSHLGRPIATPAAYPAGMADDVHRPGFNGRVWVSRPIIGGVQGPYATAEGMDAERYGAFGSEDATVYARVGHQAIAIDAFHPITKNGLRRLEAARNFWLKEQGYVGGVRTFVNDAYSAPSPQPHAEAPPPRPAPRATIQVPSDTPRVRSRIRVDAGSSDAISIVKFEDGFARISWPAGAPADAVARTAANGNMIQLGAPAPMPIAAAR